MILQKIKCAEITMANACKFLYKIKILKYCKTWNHLCLIICNQSERQRRVPRITKMMQQLEAETRLRKWDATDICVSAPCSAKLLQQYLAETRLRIREREANIIICHIIHLITVQHYFNHLQIPVTDNLSIVSPTCPADR